MKVQIEEAHCLVTEIGSINQWSYHNVSDREMNSHFFIMNQEHQYILEILHVNQQIKKIRRPTVTKKVARHHLTIEIESTLAN